MRCLALAQAWREAGGRAVFAAAAVAPSLRQRILNEGFSYCSIAADPGSQGDAGETAAVAQQYSAAAVVIDGYHFGDRFRDPLRAAGLVTVAIDDNGEVGHCGDDIIVNQNIHASGAMYGHGETTSKLLLGTGYVLLRREFRDALRTIKRQDGPVRNLLITLGAADQHNVTHRVIASLRPADMGEIEVRVVIGGANPHAAAIEKACSNLPAAQALRDPGAGMADLIAGADVAICAGGSTMWELAAMGVPFISVVIAENQRLAASAMESLGFPSVIAQDVESELPGVLRQLIPDALRRRQLADTGRRLVDGQGASRVCDEVRRLVRAG
jgi:UDP-2,4-diacetamido-2,4,6-trideoxy-beta-L-altropyranose hydrolase